MDSLNPSQEDNNLHLDRWHYLDYRDNKNDQNYIEWKYFNFVQKNLIGYIIYYVLDPEKHTGLGGGRVMIRLLKDGKFFGAIHKVDINAIQFDPVSAAAIMGNAEIKDLNPYKYEIRGSLENISWDLAYKQKVPTIVSFSNTNPGLMRWEKMNWLVKMPQAHVQGTIKAQGEDLKIDSLGYTDTNWGEIMPFFSKYEWGQFNNDEVSFVFGILYGIKNIKSAYFYFTKDENSIYLEKAKCVAKHMEWARDTTTRLKMPKNNLFTFELNSYTVKLSSRLVNYDLLGIKISWLLPTSVVVEQIVEYKITIEKSGVLIHDFGGLGFQEWSTRTWRKIPILF